MVKVAVAVVAVVVVVAVVDDDDDDDDDDDVVVVVVVVVGGGGGGGGCGGGGGGGCGCGCGCCYDCSRPRYGTAPWNFCRQLSILSNRCLGWGGDVNVPADADDVTLLVTKGWGGVGWGS